MTFTESEGFATARRETEGECKISRDERSTVVEGKRTLSQGQRSASDLPSAQGHFKQVCKTSRLFISSAFFLVMRSSSIVLPHFFIASALCSFHQALDNIGGCSRVERPRVVERETVTEDGSVVKRCV